MYSVEADTSKRLLVISAAGAVTVEEVQASVEKVREILSGIGPGIRVLTDFRWLESMPSAAATHVAEIMDLVAKSGASSVVRVIPDPRKDIGFNILSKFHYGPEIQVATFETLAEAIVQISEGWCTSTESE